MAKKTLKLVDPTDPASAITPPWPLGEHGMRLWQGTLREYDIADIAGREMLAQACAALDRAEELREQIDLDGAVTRYKCGVRDHPALKHELASRAFVVRTLARLGLDVEPIGRVGRPSAPWGLR